MRKLILLLLVMAASTSVAFGSSETEMTGNYTITVEENGNALVALTVYGSGTMNLPLPLDVVSPSVDGALYLQAPNGIDISVGSARKAVVTYQTSLLTTKLADLWNFEMKFPKYSSASVSISLPKNIEITRTSPQAWITHTSTTTNLLWDLIPEINDTLTLQYRFVQPTLTVTPSPSPAVTLSPPPTVIETAPTSENKSLNPPEQIFEPKSRPFFWENFVSSGILVFILSGSLYYYVRKKSAPIIIQTTGIANIMKTLTQNEHTIVDILLQNNGEMKRNKLERTSKLAKSSLASSLYRLELRNIVEIDKTGAIHYVRLTDWFKSL